MIERAAKKTYRSYSYPLDLIYHNLSSIQLDSSLNPSQILTALCFLEGLLQT